MWTRIKKLLTLLLLISVPQLLTARITRHWTYQEMLQKADLVVIAQYVSTKDTSERTAVPDYTPPLAVIGVVSEFETRIVIKGPPDIKKLQLHHYRYKSEGDKVAVSNTPELVEVTPGENPCFLLFLVKEADGKYAPVGGQTDPAGLSVLILGGGAE
jgi:hypothetical protein